MATKHRVETTFTVSEWDSGFELDLKMVVTFTAHPGYPATHVDPPEFPSAEVDTIRFFEVRGGEAIERHMPAWIIDKIVQDDAFEGWLISEANDQIQYSIEDAADANREMMREADND